MHWKTFNRMKAKHDFTVQAINGMTAQWVDKIKNRQRSSL
jgi:hypothetical protein